MREDTKMDGYKAMKLSATVNQCFSKIIGEPLNRTYQFNSPEDIKFVMDALNVMVGHYLHSMSDRQGINIKLKVLRQCPRCQNEEVEPDDKFCTICGLPLNNGAGEVNMRGVKGEI